MFLMAYYWLAVNFLLAKFNCFQCNYFYSNSSWQKANCVDLLLYPLCQCWCLKVIFFEIFHFFLNFSWLFRASCSYKAMIWIFPDDIIFHFLWSALDWYLFLYLIWHFGGWMAVIGDWMAVIDYFSVQRWYFKDWDFLLACVEVDG